MPDSSSPPAPRASVREVVEALAVREGEARVVEVCAALIGGASPDSHPDIALGLTGHDAASTDAIRDRGFHDYWWPTWGARALLYVWSPSAAPAVLLGVGHEHWRPAEMCLKVAAKRELGEAAEGAVTLADHELPRVRAVALRTLGLVGDTEHVPTVRAGLADPEAQVRRAAALALERMVVRHDLPSEVLP